MNLSQRIILVTTAIVLVGIALWVHLGGDREDWRPPALTASELAGLKPDLDGDLRILGHLRRLAGPGIAEWKALPESGRHLYATLWVEDVHRTGSWAQMTEVDPAELTGPTLEEAADAYDALGLTDPAAAVRRLGAAFARDRIAALAWVNAMRAGRAGARPLGRDTAAAAKTAFGRLDAIRARRLDIVRAHTADLDIR